MTSRGKFCWGNTMQLPCEIPMKEYYFFKLSLIDRAQTNLEKTEFFVTLRENLENSGNFREIFQIPGKLREFC